LRQQEPTACVEIIISLYDYATTRINDRFKITDEHVTAALLDPSQKKLPVIDKYLENNKTRRALLKEKILHHDVAALIQNETPDVPQPVL
jgi:hypothetical protein